MSESESPDNPLLQEVVDSIREIKTREINQDIKLSPKELQVFELTSTYQKGFELYQDLFKIYQKLDFVYNKDPKNGVESRGFLKQRLEYISGRLEELCQELVLRAYQGEPILD